MEKTSMCTKDNVSMGWWATASVSSACLQSTRRDANHFRTGHLRLYFTQCLQARISSFAICFLDNT